MSTLTSARSGIARSGATRSNYIFDISTPATADISISIGGIATGGPGATMRVLIASLTIHDALNETPNTCQFTVQGTRPAEGADVVITYGAITSSRRMFAGSIIRVTQVYAAGKPANVLYQIEAIDWSWELTHTLVSARYTSQSASAIGRDLLRFAPASFTAVIYDGLPMIDEISFTMTPLLQAYAQLAGRIGGYTQVDYFKRIRLYLTPDAAAFPPPATLTPTARFRDFVITRDFTQLITRALVEGGGVNAAGAVPPGETRLPVEDTAWYPAAGAWVTCGPQRIRYTGIVASGGGAMASAVGGQTGNTAPPAGPTVGTQPGAGLPPGIYSYAYTWLTPTGECLPSPLVPFNTGAAGGPAAAPILALQTGAGLGLGRYRYVYTWTTATGETVASPLAEATTSATPTAPPADTQPTCLKQTGTGLPAGLYVYGVTFLTAVGETTASGPQSVTTTSTQGQVAISNLQIGPAGVTGRRIYRSVKGGGTRKFLMTIPNNTATTYLDTALDTALGADEPTTNTTTVTTAKVAVSAIAAGPSGVTGRNLYRTVVGGTAFKLLTTLANNTTTTFTDATPDASLGAAPPTVGTAVLAQAMLSGITVGQSPTSQRRIYRTAVGGSALKLLTTLANNTATTYGPDTTPDASLGAAAPATDTSGLVSGSGGFVPAGSTSIPVASVGPFAPEGWALLAGVLIRYRSVSGTALTGIPATGPGSLGFSVPFNTPIAVVAQLTGIPASGAGAIVLAIAAGDAVNVLAIADAPDAQALVAAAIGGTGVIEGYEQDGRISYVEAVSRAGAMLDLNADVLETVRYRSWDPRTQSGAAVTVALPAPTNANGTYLIQDVTIGSFLGVPEAFPVYDVTASSRRFSFEDLIRRRRG